MSTSGCRKRTFVSQLQFLVFYSLTVVELVLMRTQFHGQLTQMVEWPTETSILYTDNLNDAEGIE